MIVAIIPARGGSKRIPRKNIKDFSAEVIPMFLNKIYTYKNEFFLLDIGTPDRLLKARELINLKNIQQ